MFGFHPPFCIASKLVRSLREAMAASLSVAITSVSSAKVADEFPARLVGLQRIVNRRLIGDRM
jgi:hypothetical protein